MNAFFHSLLAQLVLFYRIVYGNYSNMLRADERKRTTWIDLDQFIKLAGKQFMIRNSV